MPGSKSEIRYTPKQFVIFETTRPLRIKWNNHLIDTSDQDIMIGQTFEIINEGLHSVKVNGVIFNSFHDYNLLHVSQLSREAVPTLVDLFHSVLEFHEHSLSQVQEEIETICQKLIDNESESIHSVDQVKRLAGKIDKRLIIVHRYICLNYAIPITLQHLADLIHYNPVYLSNTYSSIFKISPMKHLQATRMRTAAELLKNTQLSIKEIAILVGYITNSQFTTIFRKYYFCTPNEFRRSLYTDLNESGGTR
ncbi:AraC family transcriptional regulator [Paenibacillus sp. L3-i20]|uniref:helix-turn-helix transcriptional regulator n=1 Tax=Paenibacillus sp. L3-i20 TaxID=2905833 RepID=UPI001EDCE4F5|nr:AraC family transcriptional regulator [Paenibacillus sp. L3-i20]GKU80229.1 hypothetical protein L3i20_v246260 [Paenibacillus sp. L3-i20]